MTKESLFEVIVGNIGRVEKGNDGENARNTFKTYVYMSKNNLGRAAGESVDLYENGEVVESFIGALQEAEIEMDWQDAKREMIKGRFLKRPDWQLTKAIGYDPIRNTLYVVYTDGLHKKFIPLEEEQHAQDWKYADLKLP